MSAPAKVALVQTVRTASDKVPEKVMGVHVDADSGTVIEIEEEKAEKSQKRGRKQERKRERK
jgi:hypothetical protein